MYVDNHSDTGHLTNNIRVTDSLLTEYVGNLEKFADLEEEIGDYFSTDVPFCLLNELKGVRIEITNIRNRFGRLLVNLFEERERS